MNRSGEFTDMHRLQAYLQAKLRQVTGHEELEVRINKTRDGDETDFYIRRIAPSSRFIPSSDTEAVRKNKEQYWDNIEKIMQTMQTVFPSTKGGDKNNLYVGTKREGLEAYAHCTTSDYVHHLIMLTGEVPLTLSAPVKEVLEQAEKDNHAFYMDAIMAGRDEFRRAESGAFASR